MKEYKVEITKEALSDMEAIYEYIANDLLAPEYAIGQYNRIAKAILKLSYFPEKYRVGVCTTSSFYEDGKVEKLYEKKFTYNSYSPHCTG